MIVCPRCDGQGYIYKGKIDDKIVLYICDECDACWEKTDDINAETFKDLTLYLERKGILMKDIEDLGYIE